MHRHGDHSRETATGKESLPDISKPVCSAFPEELPRRPGFMAVLCCPSCLNCNFPCAAPGPLCRASPPKVPGTGRSWMSPGAPAWQPPAQTHSAASPLLTFSVVQLLRYSGRTLPMLPFSGNSWITSRPLVRAGREAQSSKMKSSSRCWNTHTLLYTRSLIEAPKSGSSDSQGVTK